MRWEDCYREDRGDGTLILVAPEVPKLAVNLLGSAWFPCVAFLLAVLPTSWRGGRAAVLGAGRASRAWFAGFRCGCESGQCAVDAPESAADPGRGLAPWQGWALPGQAEVFAHAAGEP
jgi:hypothetical protein